LLFQPEHDPINSLILRNGNHPRVESDSAKSKGAKRVIVNPNPSQHRGGKKADGENAYA